MFILTDFCGGKDNLIINTDKLECEFYSEYIEKDNAYEIKIKSKYPIDSDWNNLFEYCPILSGLYESEAKIILDKLNSKNNRQFVCIQNGEVCPLKYMNGGITLSKIAINDKDINEISVIRLVISSHDECRKIDVIYSNLHRIIYELLGYNHIEGYTLWFDNRSEALYQFKRIINALNYSYYSGMDKEVDIGGQEFRSEYRI